MFDIAKLDTRTLSEKGVPMQILHPKNGAPVLDDKGKPVTISLLGPNSAVFKGKQRELQLRRSDMESRGIVMTPADFERERFDLLTTITVDWSFDTLDNNPFGFSDDNAKLFWADNRWAWLQTQAWIFVNNEGNYLPS